MIFAPKLSTLERIEKCAELGKIEAHEEIQSPKEPEKTQCIPSGENFGIRIYKLFDDASSSTSSFFASAAVMFLIVVSCLNDIVSSMPKHKFPNYGSRDGDTAEIFRVIESFCMITFTVEYVIRLMCAPFVTWAILKEDSSIESIKANENKIIRKIWYFITKPFNMVDLLAILPYYIGLFSHSGSAESLSILRVLRLFRVFRVFKIGKYAADAHIYISVIVDSMGALTLMLFFSLITSVVCGSLLYYLEKGTWSESNEIFERPNIFGDDKERSPFSSIPVAMWWVFATTTTVGYGDIYPTTTGGRFIAILTMNLGILGFALPVTVIGSNFSKLFSNQQRHDDVDNRTQQQKELEDALKIRKINSSIHKIQMELLYLTDLLEEQSTNIKNLTPARKKSFMQHVMGSPSKSK